MNADLVITNGKIVTMDARESVAEAVAIKFGRILAVGATSDIGALIGDETKVIDIEGRTVIPGLIDSHCHMASTGAAKMISVDLSEEMGVKSIVDIQQRLREKAKGTPKGEWLVGVREDDSKLTEKRHPDRWDLDEATSDHPIFVSTVGGHFYMVNSKALELAGVPKTRRTPWEACSSETPRQGR